MKNNPIISIVVPIYKVEVYLHRCIDSLLVQDMQDIEIILVDDGSPDLCPGICDDYAKQFNCIKVIHKANGGLSSARNAGIDIASGDWIMFVDSDDFVEKNYCSYALNIAQNTNSDIVVFGYNDIYTDRIEKQTQSINCKYTSKEALAELHGGKILSFAWNKIYKATLFNDTWYPEGRLYEDIGTTYKLFAKANAIYLADGVTYNYQKRADSIVGKGFCLKDSIDWFDMEMQRFRFMKDNYPHILTHVWYDYGKTVLRCCKQIDGAHGHKEKKKEVENFLIEHRHEILSSGLRDKELILFYHSKFLFRLVRRLKAILKGNRI